jgi:hypothetical protein
VLNHVGAEKITVGQRIDRRDKSEEKYGERNAKIGGAAPSPKGEKISRERERGEKQESGIPPPGGSEELVCSHRRSGRM